MDSRTAKVLKCTSCILNNIIVFATILVFSFDRILSSIEAVNNTGDAGYITLTVSIIMLVAIMLPSIFSLIVSAIANIVMLTNNALDTKGLRSKIKFQIITETIQFGLTIIMAMLSGWIAFLIITFVSISIQLINVYVWNSIK